MAVKRITRTIQWYGLIRFPTLEEGERIHWWRLIADMKRRPKSEYRNDGVWQPPRGFWGNVCLRRDKRVVMSAQLEFQNQIVMEVTYTEAFLHQAISCHLDATLKSIENLGLELQLTPISRVNPIRDWKPYSMNLTDLSIKMISENAIADFILEYDLIPDCSIDGTKPQGPEGPPPPEGPPEPPEGEKPSPISPPYEGRDDGGETYNPDPPPDTPDFPIGSDCQVYEIVVEYRIIGQSPESPSERASAFFYAPIEAVLLERFSPSDQSPSVVVRSAGRTDVQQCQPGQRETIVANNIESFEIVSILPVEVL